MRKFVLPVAVAAWGMFAVGCASVGGDRPRGDQAAGTYAPPTAAVAAAPGAPPAENGPLIPDEDTGSWHKSNPIWHWGNITEKSGYPYTGHRSGCDVFYIPSINYCKYFNHPERLTRIDRVWETDAQGLVDDIDTFLLQDRVTYLTKYYQR